jgi:hypothetical protein
MHNFSPKYSQNIELLDQLSCYGPFKKSSQLKGVSGGGHGKGLQRRAGRAISVKNGGCGMRQR